MLAVICERGPTADCVNEESFLGDMGDYPTFRFSRKQVIKAGKMLRGSILDTPDTREEAIQVFRIAYNWRNSHVYPMRRIRHELVGKVRQARVGAITAARIKRMVSIRRKLARYSVTLVQIQDLGACRAIVDAVADVEALAQIYRNGGSAHGLREDTSYIEVPKDGGYRSHHLVLEFLARETEQMFSGRRIEIQLRTRLQHIWATAVEAVGLARGEDLKAGQGDPDWLRLFALMSSEFAEVEGCPLVPGTGEQASRRDEIKALDRKLGAVDVLENLNYAFKRIEHLGGQRDKWFLIQFDRAERSVAVTSYNNSVIGSDTYTNEEYFHENLNSVLVEVDKVDNLRAAYPNYFLDVGEFSARMSGIVRGKPPLVRQTSLPTMDLSWWINKKLTRRVR